MAFHPTHTASETPLQQVLLPCGQVEPLRPPATAPVGERVFFGEEGVAQPDPASPNKVRHTKRAQGLAATMQTVRQPRWRHALCDSSSTECFVAGVHSDPEEEDLGGAAAEAEDMRQQNG